LSGIGPKYLESKLRGLKLLTTQSSLGPTVLTGSERAKLLAFRVAINWR